MRSAAPGPAPMKCTVMPAPPTGDGAGDAADDQPRPEQPRARPGRGERRGLGGRAACRSRPATRRSGVARRASSRRPSATTQRQPEPPRRLGERRLVGASPGPSASASSARRAMRRARRVDRRRAPRPRSRRAGSRCPATVMASPRPIASPASPAASRSCRRPAPRGRPRCVVSSPPSRAGGGDQQRLHLQRHGVGDEPPARAAAPRARRRARPDRCRRRRGRSRPAAAGRRAPPAPRPRRLAGRARRGRRRCGGCARRGRARASTAIGAERRMAQHPLDADRAGAGADVPEQLAAARRERGEGDGADLALGDLAVVLEERRPAGRRRAAARGRPAPATTSIAEQVERPRRPRRRRPSAVARGCARPGRRAPRARAAATRRSRPPRAGRAIARRRRRRPRSARGCACPGCSSGRSSSIGRPCSETRLDVLQRPAEPGGGEAEGGGRRDHRHLAGVDAGARGCAPTPCWNGSPEASTQTGAPAQRQHLGHAGVERARPGPRLAADQRRGEREVPAAAEHDLGLGDQRAARPRRGRRRRPRRCRRPRATLRLSRAGAGSLDGRMATCTS